MRAFLPLLALLAGCGGCASVPEVPSHEDLRNLSLRLEWPDTVCTGTPVAADVIRTAAHCLSGPGLIVNGTFVAIVAMKPITTDVVDITIAGQRFDRWAVLGPALKQGDRVRWFGSPAGQPDMYREGYVVRSLDGEVLIDAPVFGGDSGGGVFSIKGELVAVVVSNRYWLPPLVRGEDGKFREAPAFVLTVAH